MSFRPRRATDLRSIDGRMNGVVIISPPPLLPVRARSIAMSVPVCLSVRSHISNTTDPNFTKFSIRVKRAPLLGPPLTTVQYVMYFRFYG